MTDPFQSEEPLKISVTLKSHPGYGAGSVNFRGSPDEVGAIFAVAPNEDGTPLKASQILAQVSKVEAWYQANHEETLKELGLKPGKAEAPATGRPGQPVGSLTAPSWMGEAPVCDHGQTMIYKRILRKDETFGHLWECVARVYPDPEQCKSVYPKKGN